MHEHRPRIQIIVYQYDFDGTFKGVLTSDEKECSGEAAHLSVGGGDDRAIVKPINIDFTFSGFHQDTATFRVGFCIIYKAKDNWRNLTQYLGMPAAPGSTFMSNGQ